MQTKQIKLEPRECVVCKNPFKVMPTSKQKHCSLICKDDPKFIQRLKESGWDPVRSTYYDEED